MLLLLLNVVVEKIFKKELAIGYMKSEDTGYKIIQIFIVQIERKN